jgi:hypothetical protein
LKKHLFKKKMQKISETLLNQIKCCSPTDGHITIEPILLKCGGNICKQCIIESGSGAIGKI